jgi:hypothetical protein
LGGGTELQNKKKKKKKKKKNGWKSGEIVFDQFLGDFPTL